jgi:VanZ family protein
MLTLLMFDPRYRRLEFRAAFALFFAVVAFGSIPGARQEMASLASGLVLHALTYSVISLLLFSGANGSPRTKAIKAVMIVAAMGLIDEGVQSFFPYRRAALGDWFVDVVAALITAVVLLTFWPKQSAQQPAAQRKVTQGNAT